MMAVNKTEPTIKVGDLVHSSGKRIYTYYILNEKYHWANIRRSDSRVFIKGVILDLIQDHNVIMVRILNPDLSVCWATAENLKVVE